MHPLSAFDYADAHLLTLLACWYAFLLVGFSALGGLWLRTRSRRRN